MNTNVIHQKVIKKKKKVIILIDIKNDEEKNI
jgi:hypothetical protein